jgi:hypothetical protein
MMDLLGFHTLTKNVFPVDLKHSPSPDVKPMLNDLAVYVCSLCVHFNSMVDPKFICPVGNKIGGSCIGL